MAAPHVAGAVALLLQRHRAGRRARSSRPSSRPPATAWADTARTVEAPVLTSGAGLVDVVARERPEALHRSRPRSRTRPERHARRRVEGRCCSRSPTPATAQAPGRSRCSRSRSRRASRSSSRARSRSRPAATLQVPGHRSRGRGRRAGRGVRHAPPPPRATSPEVPYALLVTRPGLATRAGAPARQFQVGDTRTGVSRASAYRYPAAAVRARAELRRRAGERGRRREALPDPASTIRRSTSARP